MKTLQGAPALNGNAAVRQLNLRGLLVSEARFPAGLFLPSHYHDAACLTVMLEGSLHERFPGRTLDCVAGTVLGKPWEERHEDRFGPHGSHQILIELPAAVAEDLAEASKLLRRVTLSRNPASCALGRRITREFARPDGASRLAIEAAALELMHGIVNRTISRERRPPRWLLQARDALMGDLWAAHSTRDLAAAAGVHPGYFARQFRVHFGASVGAFVRHARLDWAAAQLRESRRPLSEIAHVAGFADHSHFTREFRRRFGIPPREYRERYP